MGVARVGFVLCGFVALAAPAAWGQEQSCGSFPGVVQHAAPVYPPLARQTRISGDVRLKITTDGAAVQDVEVERGHPLLQQAAVDNVRTWKFVKHAAGAFEVTFRYKLLSDKLETEFLESPGLVTLVAAPPEIAKDPATVRLGTWKAEFSSPISKFSRMLKLNTSGPDELWGQASAGKGAPEKVDFGYKRGDFLAFTIELQQAGGKRVKTLFAGKMTKDRIVGTFVDDAGVTGEWTATRLSQ